MTNDKEMQAIETIAAAFADLDRQTCERILAWAKDRYVDGPYNLLKSNAIAEIMASDEKLRERARKLGVEPMKLMHAYSALRERKVAPIEVRKEIEEAETKLVAEANG